MQPALGKFSAAKLIFEDVEEANSRKYPAQKSSAKEFIAQFYNDGKIININNFLTSMVVEDISRQLKERGHNGTFTFAVCGDNPLRKSPLRVFTRSKLFGSHSKLTSEDLKQLTLFKSLTSEAPTIGIILEKAEDVISPRKRSSGEEVFARLTSTTRKENN
jgi:hypothetical protein